MKPTTILFVFLLVAKIQFALSSSLVDASIVGYTDETNNRFTNSNQFILHGTNLSGIGKEPDVTFAANESSRWATAISRNVVISAYHGRPSGAVHFHADNDPNSTPVIRNVVSGQRVGSTDLWIGVLDYPLPDTIQHFRFATETLTGTPEELTTAGSFQDSNAFLSSQIRRADDPQQDQRIGRNRVTGYVENIDFLNQTDNDAILFEFDPQGHADFVDFETRFISEDSGGPTFVDINGDLVLLGINAFNYTTDGVELEVGSLTSAIRRPPYNSTSPATLSLSQGHLSLSRSLRSVCWCVAEPLLEHVFTNCNID